MKKFFRTLFHLATFPALIVGVFYVDWELIKAQYQYVGVWAMIGVLSALAIALLFYGIYAIVTHAKKINKFCQTVIVMVTASALMAGSWALVTYLMPNLIAEKTSDVVVCEDLTDKGRLTRTDLNNELIDDFVEANVRAGILPMTFDSYREAVTYYRSHGIDEKIPLLTKYEESTGKKLSFHTLHELFSKQFQGSGYTSSDIEFVNDTRLAIPCMLQFEIKKSDINESDLKNLEPGLSYKIDGEKVVIKEIIFAYYNQTSGTVACESSAWDYVLDDQELSLLLCVMDGSEVPNTGNYFLFDENIFGSASISLTTKGEKDWTGKAEIMPSATFQGVCLSAQTKGVPSKTTLTYGQMSYLKGNDSLYALASLAKSAICYQYATVVFAGLFLLDGLFRTPSREERKKRRQERKMKKAIVMKPMAPRSVSPCTPWQQATSFVDVAQMKQIEKTDIFRMNSQLLSDGRKKIRRGYPISLFYEKKR